MDNVVKKVSDAQVMGDLDASVAYAKASGKADTSRLGITGFCWGGRTVWMYAAHNPGLKAAVAWYGPLDRSYYPGDKSVLDVVKDLKAPVLGLYGGADQGIPVETVNKMRDALRAAKKPGDLIVYPDTPHGFNADYRGATARRRRKTVGSACDPGSPCTEWSDASVIAPYVLDIAVGEAMSLEPSCSRCVVRGVVSLERGCSDALT